MRSSFRSFAVKCSKFNTWWHLQQRVHFELNFLQHPQLIHCCRNMQLSHCCVLSPASSMEWLSRILTRADRVSTLFGIPAFSPCTGHSFLLLLYTPVHKHGDYAEFWRTQQNIFVESDLFDPLDLFLTLVRVMGWSRQLRMTWQNLDACNAEQSHLRSRWRPFCTWSSDIIFLVSCARACGQ